MRKEFRHALKVLFSEGFGSIFPEFVVFDERSPGLGAGEIVYVWKASTALWIFCVVVPDPKGQEDVFTIEVGWSRRERFPELSMRPNIMQSNDGHGEFNLDEGFIRIGLIAGRQDLWWGERAASGDVDAIVAALMLRQKKLNKDEARKRLEPFVREAFDALVRFGRPYIDALVTYTSRDTSGY